MGNENYRRSSIRKHSWIRLLRTCATTALLVTILPLEAAAYDDDRMWPTPNSTHQDCLQQNPDSGSSVCLPDSDIQTFYYDNLDSRMDTATDRTLAWSWDTLDYIVDWRRQSTPKWSGTWETDVIYRDRNFLPWGVLGWATCEDTADSSPDHCDQFYITYHMDHLCGSTIAICGTDTGDQNKRQALACHETGHTLGFVHPENSNPIVPYWEADYECMRTDPPPSASNYDGNNTWLSQRWVGQANVWAMGTIQYNSYV